MDTDRSNRLFIWLIVFAMVIWGGSWPSAKAVSRTLPAETLTFWRFLINFLCFVPIMIFLKQPFRMSQAATGYAVLGALSMGVYFYLFFKGLAAGYAGAGGVLVTSMVPLSTMLLSVILFRQKFFRRDYFGIGLGMLGGAVLLKVWSLDAGKILMSGNIYFLICPPLWALVTISSQRAGSLATPLTFSFYTYMICSAIFFLLALPHGIMDVFRQDWLFWFNMFYLGVISSSFATTVYFIASSRMSSYRISSFIFVVPSSAMVFSWIFLGETPEPATIIGGVLAVTATYVINVRR